MSGFDPIIIRYEGKEAKNGAIDLGEVGQSLVGASRILAAAANLVQTGRYAKQAQSMTVKVLAGTPRPGSWEIIAIFVPVASMAAPLFPTMADIAKATATKAVTAVFSYAVGKWTKKPSEVEAMRSVAETALTELGQTSRAAFDAMARIAENNRGNARLYVVPVGQSVDTAQVGKTEDGALQVDAIMRAALEAPEPVEIGESSEFEIQISELDLVNRSCKVQLRGNEDTDARISGEITDPALNQPANKYSKALDSQTWIKVWAKPETIEGEIVKLFISDARELTALLPGN